MLANAVTQLWGEAPVFGHHASGGKMRHAHELGLTLDKLVDIRIFTRGDLLVFCTPYHHESQTADFVDQRSCVESALRHFTHIGEGLGDHCGGDTVRQYRVHVSHTR